LEFSASAFLERLVAGDSEAVKLFLSAGMSPHVAGGGYTALLEAARHDTGEFAYENARRLKAVREGLERGGLGSWLLIVDWDLHHGNGTQAIFYRDGSVFYFSTHQLPWYPWTGAAGETGEGEGKGTTLNVPLPAGSGDKEIVDAFERRLRPAMDHFRPASLRESLLRFRGA
jgi:hypothetical protein